MLLHVEFGLALPSTPMIARIGKSIDATAVALAEKNKQPRRALSHHLASPRTLGRFDSRLQSGIDKTENREALTVILPISFIMKARLHRG